MKIGILLLGLVASLAAAAPARNQTTTPIAPPRNSTTGAGRNNAVSASDCKNYTLRWSRVHVWDFFREPKSKIEFTVAGHYYGQLALHEDDLSGPVKYCSPDNWTFCVTHYVGHVDQVITIQYNGYAYKHRRPHVVHHVDTSGEDWDYEYWGCAKV